MMFVVGSREPESDEASRTLRELFAEIESGDGPVLSAEHHRTMTADVRADRGTVTTCEAG